MTSYPEMPGRSQKRTADPSRSAIVYPRKRAVTACSQCRQRRRKCDNIRPKCGYCESLQTNCIYDDPANPSSFDPASLQIMSLLHQTLEDIGELRTRLDGLASVVEHPAARSAMTRVDLSSVGSVDIGQPNHTHVTENPIATNSATQATPPAENTAGTHNGTETDSLKVSCLTTRPHAMLSWPVFKNKYSPGFLNHALETTFEDELEMSSDINAFNSSIYMSLVENFLTYVHIKNPILDAKTLRAYARRVTEVGFEWNGPSCLVAIACALGYISGPYQPTSPDIFDSPVSHHNRSEQSIRILKAESFYVIARRRIGLLRRSIITSQCFFFSAVYCMYQLRPLEACTNFVQASTTYQVYLKSTSAFAGQHNLQAESLARDLEDRLYWSCFKSERYLFICLSTVPWLKDLNIELRVEVEFPESGIADFQYPNLFPAPPQIDSDISEDSKREQEQIWYYYSTEITLCRIRNRVLNALYQNPATSWLEIQIQTLVQRTENFLAQIAQCMNDLPKPIRYDLDDLSTHPTEELPSLVRSRILDIKCILLRPIVFYAIHKPQSGFQLSLNQNLVDEAINCELHRIRINSTPHLHHGTWFACRGTMRSAFTIAAAVKSRRINMPTGWADDFRLAIETLSYWESEATEFTRSRKILEELLEELQQPESILEE